MKFVINTTVAADANKQLVRELEPISHLFGGEWPRIRSALLEEGCEVTHLKHVSITQVGDEWVIWVDDQIITRQLAMVGRFVRLFSPLIVAVMQVGRELGVELAQLRDWLRTPR